MQLIKITKANIELLNEIMDLIFDEWGESFSCSKEEKLNKLKTPIFNGEKFPTAYLLKNDSKSNLFLPLLRSVISFWTNYFY